MAATIDVLAPIVDAVDGRAEVYLDGGVRRRRGTDVVTALALGARAVFVGRPFLYALAAAGEAGVARAVEILRAETTTAMALLGVRPWPTSPATGSSEDRRAPRPASVLTLERRILVDRFALDERQQHARIGGQDLRREEIPVEDDEVGQFADLDRAGLGLEPVDVRGPERERMHGGLQRDPLVGNGSISR